MRSTQEGPTFTEQARREQIVQAAIELIASEGYVQASISRIAQRAGIAKSVVLYYFSGKEELVTAIVQYVFAQGAAVIVPAVTTEPTSDGRLSAYIRANCAFLAGHPQAAAAMHEIMTSFRTHDGLRLDQAAARSVEATPPPKEWELLDPVHIFEQGRRDGRFDIDSPQTMASILRAALDGAAAEVARDPAYDVTGYGEALVTIFDRATRRNP